MTVKTTLESPKTGGTVSHTVRTRDGGKKALKYARKQAIYLTCTECMGWDENPSNCTSPLCPIYPFRGYTRASLRGE
jgi:hypothetical protein